MLLAYRVPVTFTCPSGEPVHVVNAGANYEYVGRLVLAFDEQGRVSTLDARSGLYATDPEGVVTIGTYMAADQPCGGDERIQNLAFRADSTTRPSITGIRIDATTARVRFTTLPGKTYALDAQDAINGTWSPVGLTILGTGTPAELPDAAAGSADLRLYRVRY
jgi:hypothetical protein